MYNKIKHMCTKKTDKNFNTLPWESCKILIIIISTILLPEINSLCYVDTQKVRFRKCYNML